MKVELLEIPGLAASDQTACRIRVLSIDGKSLALAALELWESAENADFKKIMKNIRILGQLGRDVRDEKRVKKCSNPSFDGTYEIRADKGSARLMFFFDDAEGLLVICTNDFWKGSGNQDTAFKHCFEFRTIYFKTKQ